MSDAASQTTNRDEPRLRRFGELELIVLREALTETRSSRGRGAVEKNLLHEIEDELRRRYT